MVIDFRDERSLNKSIPFSTFMHYLYAFYTENYVFRNAAKISVVTPQLLEIFRRIHAKVDPNKFYLITNGLDFEEYDSIQFESLPNNGVDKFIIGYSGSYYYDPISHALAAVPAWKRPGMKKISYQQKHTSENWFYRSPYYFFKALRELFDRRADLVDKIEFHHVGHCPHWLNDMVGEFNLSENFITYGFVTKSENISIQKKFNLLLCTSEKLLNEDHYGLSSKVFDYVYLQKPLLGFVTPGITKDFIEKSGCGIICNPDDPIDSSYKIEYLYENRVIFKPDKEFLSAFKPDVLTLRLRSLFDLVLNNQ